MSLEIGQRGKHRKEGKEERRWLLMGANSFLKRCSELEPGSEEDQYEKSDEA